MEKPVECKACRRWFRASGEWDSTKEVPRTINCPNCGEPSEVEWPENLEVHATLTLVPACTEDRAILDDDYAPTVTFPSRFGLDIRF